MSVRALGGVLGSDEGWVALLEHLAGAAWVLLNHWRCVGLHWLSATAMLFPVLRASDGARHLMQGALPLGNASVVMTATCAQLVGDSHHHS